MTRQTEARQWSLGPKCVFAEPKNDRNPESYESLQPGFTVLQGRVEARATSLKENEGSGKTRASRRAAASRTSGEPRARNWRKREPASSTARLVVPCSSPFSIPLVSPRRQIAAAAEVRAFPGSLQRFRARGRPRLALAVAKERRRSALHVVDFADREALSSFAKVRSRFFSRPQSGFDQGRIAGKRRKRRGSAQWLSSAPVVTGHGGSGSSGSSQLRLA
jgi:hypothetical protein